MLFAELASDFGGELVVGGGPFREPPTVMQSTVIEFEAFGSGDHQTQTHPLPRRSPSNPQKEASDMHLPETRPFASFDASSVSLPI